MPRVWKVAPGQRANNWDICRRARCIALGWDGIGDFGQYETEKAILWALRKAYGKSKNNGSGAAKTIWRFVHVIQPDDVIVANKGDSEVVGVGVVKGGYLHAEHPENPVPVPPEGQWWRRNARLVDWRIKEPVDLRERNFFVASTVQRLTPEKCERIRQAFLKKYPQLGAMLDQLFDDVQAHEEAGQSADSHYADESDIEGTKTEVVQLKSSRSRRLRRLALRAASGVCCVCERDYSKLLGGRGVRVLQVHHRKQLAARHTPSLTKVGDLAVVCANCHMLLHLDPAKALRVEELRRMLRRDGL
jgi:hypothetical protein